MIYIPSDTFVSAYKKLIREIVWRHEEIITEDKELTWESEAMVIQVSNPCRDLNELIRVGPYGKKFMCDYADEIIKGKGDSDFDYTYHERIFEHVGVSGRKVNVIHTDTFNQITYIVNKLMDAPESRRAVAITLQPGLCSVLQHDNTLVEFGDYGTKTIPCLQFLQFLIRKNQLNMYVVWRSRDMLMGFPANVFGMNHLHELVSSKLNVDIGSYTEFVVSPHIYFKRDSDELKKWM